MTCEYTGILKWLYDWQTLITGLLALAAAYVAARPIWRQLKLSTRDTLLLHVSALESMRAAKRRLINGITAGFMSQLRPYDDERELDPHPEWASDAQSQVGGAIAALNAYQETSLDGELIDRRRKAVIQECKALSECLYDIHAPYSTDLGGFESPAEEERLAFLERGRRAGRDLEKRISAVVKADIDLDRAFADKLKQLRHDIRSVDTLVVHDKIT